MYVIIIISIGIHGKGSLDMKKNFGKERRFNNHDNERELDENLVVGRNAVRELLKSARSIDKIFVLKGEREGSITMLVAQAIEAGIPVVECEKQKLDNMTGGMVHQGIVAMASAKEYVSVEDILEIAEERGEKPLILIADGVEDPHNLGAIIRVAEGAGFHGLIIPKRRASGVTAVVEKASAGALEHLAVAKVANLASAVQKLKELGVWVYAAEAGGTPYYDVDFAGPAAIIVGSEGFGVSKLLKDLSDFNVSIPMYGKVTSFNVSCAAAVIVCEAARSHRALKK